MSEKCAIYLRVSSDIQDYERQISDMKKFAEENNLSFSNTNLYEDKISGFKYENEREGLNKLLKEVIEFKIKIVLVWEISRLSRKHRFLLEYTEFFQKHGINVYFYIQRFWLLDETLKISPQAGLSIAFFGWHGEYEARLTKERFFSAKKLNESLGKYNGGKITFGYTLDENNKYIINDEIIDGLKVSESDIVREVFDAYENGLTCSKICRICQSKGYPKIVCSTHTLARLLRDSSYIGFKEVKLGRRPTPPIISESQYYSVGALIDANKTKADKGKSHIYLLRGILKCSHCDAYYVGKQTDDAYICPKNSGSNKINKNSSCKGGNISVSDMDGIIWETIKVYLHYEDTKGFDNIPVDSQNEISELETQNSNFNDLLIKIEKKRKKANIIFQNDGYTESEYQRSIKDINNEMYECTKSIAINKSKIRHYDKLIRESRTASIRHENIEAIKDRHQMQTIIKSVIKEIFFYKITLFKTVVHIFYYGGSDTLLIYNSVAKNGCKFKILNKNYFRFDKNTNDFYLFKNAVNIKEWYFDRKQQDNKDSRHKAVPRIRPTIFPYLDETNSEIYDFDVIMNLADIPNILDTLAYTKLTYFKDLNKSRFNRKKLIKVKV
jgi:site-specific DNA recombinase